ncbi:MAG: ANTAR domain-containing response regulator [bacterium]
MENEARIDLGIKVLVVDDLKERREELKSILSFFTSDLNIFEADNGAAAVVMSENIKPDIIFMDIKMPNMNGIEACKKIMDIYPVPVIFLTAGQKEIDNYDNYLKFLEQIKQSGAFSYITKPAKKSEVLAQTIIAIENFKNLHNIKKENEYLKKYIEDRKALNKAKSIIMEKDKITEKEALKRLQKLSMNSGVSIGDIARAVILTNP